MEQADDASLVAAALAGGPEAFGRIVERYKDAVFGAALARVRDFHDAEDVAQQVFLEAFGKLSRLKDPSRLGAWLRSMAVHRSIDHVRRQRPSTDLDKAERERAESAWQHDEKRKDVREVVLAAIARLTQPQRETTALFYINGYTVDEVARMQEVPVGTVKRRLHDAREKLKEEMSGMVEEVLKAGAPREDFVQRVFEILSRYPGGPGRPYAHRGWHETIDELRRIGEEGLDGYRRALASPHSPTRVFAMHMLERHNAPRDSGAVLDMLKQGLADPNRKVRRHAAEALLGADVPEERKRSEFVPVIAPLLADPSIRVRRHVAWELCPWAQDVPLEPVAQALVQERDPEARKRLMRLLKAVLKTKKGP